MGLRVLVIGGTGFLGLHLLAELARRGHEPVAAARRGDPDGTVLALDAQALTAEQWEARLAGFDGVVFAAGVHADRAPVRPAADYFARGNVEPVRRMVAAAGRAGCRRVVVCGSYFVDVARRHPELRLAETHPYIRCRVEQEEAALAAAGSGVSVAVLEIPYVLGAAPGRKSALARLTPWLRSRKPLAAPHGGTAVVTAAQVAQAACTALEGAAGGYFPLAEANLTWAQLFTRLAVAAGRPEPVRVRTVPKPVLQAVLGSAAVVPAVRGREAGLNPAHLTKLLTLECFVDPEACRSALNVTPGGLDEAIEATVAAATVPLAPLV